MAQNRSPLRQILLSGATATTSSSQPVNCAGLTAIVAYCIGTGTLSAGVITIEEADYLVPDEGGTDLGYAGTWSAITTVNATSITAGVQSAIHFPLGAYRYVRARVSTTVTGGGTVAVVLAGC